MAVSKCLKCGVDIPDGAEFCPGCGAPKGAQTQAQPMQSYQPTQAAPMSMQKVSPMAGIFDMFFSKTGVIMGLAIGILLAWIGVLIGTFSDGNGDIATFMSATGFAAIGLVLVAGGVWNRKIDTRARLGMVGIGGYVLTVGLSVSNSLFGNLFSGGIS